MGLRIDESDREQLLNLLTVVASNAVDRIVSDGANFDKKLDQYPGFRDGPNVTFRKVDSVEESLRPVRYRSMFSDQADYGSRVAYEDLAGWQDLMTFVESHAALREFLAPDRLGDRLRQHVLEVNVADLPLTVAEHIAVTNPGPPTRDQLADACRTMMEWWITESLPVEILIPILNVSFEAEQVELDGNLSVVRLTDELQLARWPGRPRVNAFQELLPMATHALQIKNQTLVNQSALGWLGPPNDEPPNLPEIDRFFGVLGSLTAAPTGYAQVVYRPKGWASDISGSLPPLVQGPLVEQYSRSLQTSKEPGDILDGGKIATLRQGIGLVMNPKEQSRRIAAQRLAESERRTSDADRIIDICIGIEALVAGQPGDATYKISIRTAAAMADQRIAAANAIIDATRKIYSYRSDIVHGRERAPNSYTITFGSSQLQPLTVARLLLRELLNAHVVEPTLDIDAIDKRIIPAAFDMWAERAAESGDV